MFPTIAVLVWAAMFLAQPPQRGAAPPGAANQGPPMPRGRIIGRVLRPAADSLAGVPRQWVVLHRLARNDSGPVDSTRTDDAGRFSLPASPRADTAVYVLTSSHDGVAYFAALPSLAGLRQGDADIRVFDSTSTQAAIAVAGRHLIVFAPTDGADRQVVELYELTNDSARTRVAGSDGVVWSALVPEGARDFTLHPENEFPAAGVRFADGRVTVSAPFAPGMKQFVFSYVVRGADFPLRGPAGWPVAELEVLVEEPTLSVAAPGLEEVSPVAVQGKMFRKFVALNVPASGVIVIQAPVTNRGSTGVVVTVILAVVGTAMIVALAMVSNRRRVGAPIRATANRPAESALDVLGREIAAMDAAFARSASPTAEERASYDAERARKKERLRLLLAGRQRD